MGEATANVHVVAISLGHVAWRESADGILTSSLPAATPQAALAHIGAAAADSQVERFELGARLVRYGQGEAAALERVPLDLAGQTEFQEAVRAVVRAIPAGSTLTYGQVAEAAGSPGAARAVGRVMATNPLPLLIPCHRVLAAGGRLGGFGACLELKRQLLALEASTCAST